MRVLVFSNCELDPYLGSGRTRLAWAAGLRGFGHEVDIVDTAALLGRDGDRAGRRARIGWRGLQWLRAHDLSRYDLIEFYGAEFWPGTWWLSRRTPATRPFLVAHTDGLELLLADRASSSSAFPPPASGPRGWAAGLLHRGQTLAFSRADGFVTACELDRRFLVEHRIGNPARMEVVPLGLEPAYLERPLRTDGRENRIAFLGSWIDRKGTPSFKAAVVPLLRERPDLHLDLCGTGQPPETLRAEFPEEVRGRITVHGRIPNEAMADLLGRAKIFFFPSEYEGFGLALAEAMACGCAVVTTPTGYGAELRDGEEALRCPFEEAGAMRAALARLLDDDTLRARVAAAGWRRVQGLRWETSVGRLEAIYRRWCEEHRAGYPAADPRQRSVDNVPPDAIQPRG